MSTLAVSPDPRTAWQPWEPTASAPWSRRLAAHLFRRASFGASLTQLDEAVARSPQECVDRLLSACGKRDATTQAFDAEMATMAAGLTAGGPQALEPWWLYRMLFTPAPLQERMTLFWHGHFATSAATVASAAMMLRQNETLRQHALGDFESLVQAISRDPAMLTYLNSTTNARLHPNENYARELMELFCLGVGNYTERDVQETARCFTGWEIRRGRFRFNKYQHDFGSKSIFGQSGTLGGEHAIHLILEQASAPRFVARKLIHEFVCDQPVSDELVEPLAVKLRSNGFQIEPVVRQILTSRIFFSQASVGQKIRSPVELAIGVLRCLEATVGSTALADYLRPLGQRIFYPPNVKGWDGGTRWINATTLIGRANLIAKLLSDANVRFAGGPLTDYFDRQCSERQTRTTAQFVDLLASLLLAIPLPTGARRDLIAVAQFYERQIARSADDVLRTFAVLPEFQLG